MKLAIVTASTNLARSLSCIRSWSEHAATQLRVIIVLNRPNHTVSEEVTHSSLDPGWSVLIKPDYLGTVGAFQLGTEEAFQSGAEIIACLHDDLQILEDGWDEKVLEFFRRHPACGLAGFGGAVGLGDEDLYHKPYAPQQLARIGFRSNLVDAEKHGIRSTLAEPVACLDGFSQVGRRKFWEGMWRTGGHPVPAEPIWEQIAEQGILHHFYDGILGALAKRHGWEVWYLPVACQHFGGRTAVGDPGYQAWAKTQIPAGDQGFWEHSHKVAYEWLRDVLPIRV